MIFDKRGCLPLVLPSFQSIKYMSPYTVDWTNFQENFVFNNHRAQIATRFQKLLNKIEALDIEVVRIYIGGSFVTKKPSPNDIDVLVCWMPRVKLKNRQQLNAFISERGAVFDRGYEQGHSGLQVHFQCLLGIESRSVHMISKWILLNSYHKDSEIHKGIICIQGKTHT
ncbi:hypothetical protein BET10_16355 [Pseudoalteromonas amylolytica]|uniref:Uncharacterized protein n=2 Tax=Pseudoalteromonas TaxID=53246 RepID=A0A1S1MT61_9GAMM|nr:hypothetical protein BET10_16355 [Pseudoalteromonas amylolytica]